MAEIWAAAAVVVAAGVNYASQQKASHRAASAQERAAQMAIDQTEQNYQRTAGNLNHYINAGSSALAQMQALNGGDYSGFKESPDYQFTLGQGLQGLDRSAAAHGSLYSGGHSADVLNYAQGLASQQYNGYYSKLAGLAQSGQNASTNLGSVGTGNAAAIGANLTNAGNAQADAAINSANANSNLYGQLAGAFGQYMGNRGGTASSYNLVGNGAQPYQDINNGQFNNNGTFNFATAGDGSAQRYG